MYIEEKDRTMSTFMIFTDKHSPPKIVNNRSILLKLCPNISPYRNFWEL